VAEESYFWDGTMGDASLAPYDDGELMGVFFRALLNGTGNQGVLRGWLNELFVTDGGGLSVDVDTGASIVYGIWHESDAVENLALAPNLAQTVIVRASWAAQTVRLAVTSAALVKNPGVTYEVPLATLTTGAAAITVGPTDARDFCEFSTQMLPGAVDTTALVDDAVTIAKIEDQVRWMTRGYNQLKADATNPAAMTYGGNASSIAGEWIPYKPYWSFSDGANTDTVWATFEVPADISGATVEVFIWTERQPGFSSAATQMRWAFSSWDAQANAVLANQTGAATVVYPDLTLPYYTGLGVGDPPIGVYQQHWRYAQRDSLGTFNALAGDIVHIEIWRDGAHAGDTFTGEGALFMVEFAYTADS